MGVDTTPTGTFLCDILGGNDQFTKLAKSKEFQDCLQAIIQWVSGTFESDWTNEVVGITITSQAGSINARCGLRREQLVQRVNPSVLKDLHGEP